MSQLHFTGNLQISKILAAKRHVHYTVSYMYMYYELASFQQSYNALGKQLLPKCQYLIINLWYVWYM